MWGEWVFIIVVGLIVGYLGDGCFLYIIVVVVVVVVGLCFGIIGYFFIECGIGNFIDIGFILGEGMLFMGVLFEDIIFR